MLCCKAEGKREDPPPPPPGTPPSGAEEVDMTKGVSSSTSSSTKEVDLASVPKNVTMFKGHLRLSCFGMQRKFDYKAWGGQLYALAACLAFEKQSTRRLNMWEMDERKVADRRKIAMDCVWLRAFGMHQRNPRTSLRKMR
jgi:hypothetical protein